MTHTSRFRRDSQFVKFNNCKLKLDKKNEQESVCMFSEQLFSQVRKHKNRNGGTARSVLECPIPLQSVSFNFFFCT